VEKAVAESGLALSPAFLSGFNSGEYDSNVTNARSSRAVRSVTADA
jgi:hypothetical protein